MKLNEFFINGKKYSTDGKTLAQLEHMSQLARIALTNYENQIRNYPPEKMAGAGKRHRDTLLNNISIIEKAISKI